MRARKFTQSSQPLRSPNRAATSKRASSGGESSLVLRLVIADDHSLFRESLARVLNERAGYTVVASAATAAEAIEATGVHLPDIALVDVAMPGNGIEAIPALLRASPTTRIVMLSAYGYEHYVASSLRAGAAGYIMKTATMDYLCAALRMVSCGEVVFDFPAANDSANGFLGPSTPSSFRTPDVRADTIHPRELDVLREVARGLGNREIAQALSISERTVQAHLSNAFGKLGVRTRTAAVMKCVAAGLVDVRKDDD